LKEELPFIFKESFGFDISNNVKTERESILLKETASDLFKADFE